MFYLHNTSIAIGPFATEADARAFRSETRLGGKAMPRTEWPIVPESEVEKLPDSAFVRVPAIVRCELFAPEAYQEYLGLRPSSPGFVFPVSSDP